MVAGVVGDTESKEVRTTFFSVWDESEGSMFSLGPVETECCYYCQKKTECCYCHGPCGKGAIHFVRQRQ
jgi:hypothetical protein